jgi:hypothetical protein
LLCLAEESAVAGEEQKWVLAEESAVAGEEQRWVLEAKKEGQPAQHAVNAPTWNGHLPAVVFLESAVV